MNEQSAPLRGLGSWPIGASAGPRFGRRPLLAALEWLSSIVLGTVLLYSGFQHIGNPYYFLSSVYQYQIVTPWLGALVAIGMPFVQIAIGICLIGRLQMEGALLACVAILSLFVVVQCFALGRGLEIPCGGFGTSKYEPVNVWTIARTVGLLALAVFGLLVRWRENGEIAHAQ